MTALNTDVLFRRNTLGIVLLICALASLTVKGLQEIHGVRILSLGIPILLVVLYADRIVAMKIPIPVVVYAVVTCLLIPLVSAVSQNNFSYYSLYLAATVICASVLIGLATFTMNKDIGWVARTYADAMVIMCLLSYFTFERQWFGGYTIRSFSDFSTFFALQVSVGMPFLVGKYRDVKRIICLTTLFFTFSRLSFVLASAVVLFQVYKERKNASLFIFPAVLIAVMLMGSFESGRIMFEKMYNTVVVIISNSPNTDLNPSDKGRVAYAVTTLDSLRTMQNYFCGHGIKTNHVIISNELNLARWGIDPSMLNATVHNVYLEVLSDLGGIGLGLFIVYVVYVGRRLAKKYRMGPHTLSFLVFLISYAFEANYVTFFFQFFMVYFLWVSSQAKRGRSEAKG